MEKEKRDKLVRAAQLGTVVAYVFFIMRSTIGEYVKLARKNMRKEAKRREKLRKSKYAKKKRKLKKQQRRKGILKRL